MTWRDLPAVKKVMREARGGPLIRRLIGTTYEIISILEENPDGLIVMDIYRKLRKRDIYISQPGVSKHVKRLEEKGLVWKTRKFYPPVKRELWHYTSTASFCYALSDHLNKELLKLLSDNKEKISRFETKEHFKKFLKMLLEGISIKEEDINKIYPKEVMI